MIGADWTDLALAAAALAVAGWFLAQALAEAPGARAVPGAHALTGAGAAAVFLPWGGPVTSVVGALVFAVLGAWFAAVRLRGGAGLDEPAHVALSSAAMVVMYLFVAGAGGDAGAAGHAGHLATEPADAAPNLVVVPVALVAAAYFVWHAWASAAPPPSRQDASGALLIRGQVRAGVAALDVLMAVMFLGAIAI